jgi:hypothetical protein
MGGKMILQDDDITTPNDLIYYESASLCADNNWRNKTVKFIREQVELVDYNFIAVVRGKPTENEIALLRYLGANI